MLSSFFLTNYNIKGAAPRGAAPFVLCVQSNLLGAVDTVAGIAQTGNDVAVLVQVVVLCTEVDVHIGVCLVQGLDAFRSSDQTDELDALCT